MIQILILVKSSENAPPAIATNTICREYFSHKLIKKPRRDTAFVNEQIYAENIMKFSSTKNSHDYTWNKKYKKYKSATKTQFSRMTVLTTAILNEL